MSAFLRLYLFIRACNLMGPFAIGLACNSARGDMIIESSGNSLDVERFEL